MAKSISIARRRSQRGSAIVEFSLVLLPLLSLLFLTLNLAWVLFGWSCIQEGVREGVRFAITGQSDANIDAVVQSHSFGFVQAHASPNPIAITYYSASNPSQTTSGSGSSCSGNIVKVVVTGVKLNPIVPLWTPKGPVTLSGAAADLVEANSKCR